MNDRELLELAAKAAGISGGWGDKLDYHNGVVDLTDYWVLEGEELYFWNPLVDGGDALALAHKLKIDIFIKDSYACCGMPDSDDYVFIEDSSLQGVYRAITTAAAQIGGNME